MIAIPRLPGGHALRVVAVAAMLALVAGRATGQPAPTGTPSAQSAAEAPPPDPAARIAAARAALATELAAARERAAAAAPEDQPALAADVEWLERIDLTLDQHALALDRVRELEQALADATAELEALRTSGPSEAPPYSLLALDAARDELEAEVRRADAVAAAVDAAAGALDVARRAAQEKEAERRRAREALETNTDEAQAPRLARALRVAQLESRLAARTAEQRETEHRREVLARDVYEKRRAVLEERVAWLARSTRFERSEFEAKRLEIETRREQLRLRQAPAQRNAEYLEGVWYEAKRRLDEQGGDDPVLAAEVEARRLAFQAQREEADAISRQLERLANAADAWQRRFDVSRRGVDRETLREWETQTRARLEALTTEYRIHAARTDDVRNQLAALSTRIEGAEGDADLRRRLLQQREHLRSIADTLTARLASIDASRRLHERLLADIGAERAEVSLAERAADLWQRVIAVWRFELTSIDERPITVGKVVAGLLILVFGLLASRVLSRFLGRRVFPRLRLNEGAAAAVQSLVFYVLFVTFALFALRAVNIPLTAFTVLGGALAIGVGFGSQNVIGNFISGLILLAERPVRVGDLIQLQDLHGTVEHIGARSTRVRTGDNVEIIVPNSSFLEQNVVNWTLTEDRVRTHVSVGVVYGAPTREVTRLLRHAVDDHGRILKKPAPVVLFRDFGDNALLFEVHFWLRMRTMMDRRTIESDVRYRIDSLFREAEITIAFPQRDVHLDTLRPLDVRVVSDEGGPEPAPPE